MRPQRHRFPRGRQIGAVALCCAGLVAVSACGGGSNAGTGHVTHTSRHVDTRPAVPAARRLRLAVPILTYHVIAAPPPGAPFPGLYVTPSLFAAQVAALARAGWRGVTLDEVLAYWRDGTPLPRGRPIVLTFDNGYHSQYADALPVLRQHRWVADENLQLTGLPPSQGGLTAAQVRALVRSGWELDTQGISHADLVTLGPGALRHEVATARQVIQRRFDVPVRWFCYPSGHYDATVINAVRRAGYVGSTTTITGWARAGDDPYRLQRIRVLAGTAPSALLEEIAAARRAGPPPPAYDGG